MTLDEEIEFWKSAMDGARTKELALVAFGFWCGLRTAKQTDGEKHDAVLAPNSPHRHGAQVVSDVVERLRNYARNCGGPPEDYLTWQAADEIERLRAALQDALAMVGIST